LKSNDENNVLRSDLLEVALAIYHDACASCLAVNSDLRDVKTLTSRVKDEGVSFLTITLPTFAKDFERSLADGVVGPNLFRNFRKRGAIPAFLQGMLGQIFDYETGRIYEQTTTASNDVPTIIACVRQICLAFKKVELPCTPERAQAAFDSFATIEQSFEMSSVSREDSKLFDLVSSLLWDGMFNDFHVDMLSLRHGPGTTAEGITGNRKFIWQRWHERLEVYFPFLGNAYPIGAYPSKDFEDVAFVPEHLEQPVKVVQVPKTLKSPRIIAIEPVCMQYAQQGIRSYLYDRLESHPITGGHVNFRDQSINQKLAMSSSTDGRLATIDLSDASDRVPFAVVKRLFQSNPLLWDCIEACRSRRAKLPDGREIFLKKFASMGSALCFPVEAMYFYTICVASLLRQQNLPVSRKNIFFVSRDVYVYGDDIIVPSRYASTVLDDLQKYNCKVNTNKTFVTGKFRESCGVDAYDGVDVTPTYISKRPPKNRRQVPELISWVETGRSFYRKGFLRTSSLLFHKVESILGSLPQLPDNSEGLGRNYSLETSTRRRWSAVLQRHEVLAWVPRPVYRTDRLVGYAALNKSLSGLASKPKEINLLDLLPSGRDPLELSALYGAVAIKRRWVAAPKRHSEF
jgi:hypothetical protein